VWASSLAHIAAVMAAKFKVKAPKGANNRFNAPVQLSIGDTGACL
jgi:predicted secreted protein